MIETRTIRRKSTGRKSRSKLPFSELLRIAVIAHSPESKNAQSYVWPDFEENQLLTLNIHLLVYDKHERKLRKPRYSERKVKYLFPENFPPVDGKCHSWVF